MDCREQEEKQKEHFGSYPWGGGQAWAPEMVVGKKAEEKIEIKYVSETDQTCWWIGCAG